MKHTSSVRMAHEYGASKESFEKVTHNADRSVDTLLDKVYDDEDIHHALTRCPWRTPTPNPV